MMRLQRRTVGVLACLSAIAALSGCGRGNGSLSVDSPAATCAAQATIENVKSIVFENAAKRAPAEQRLAIPQLGRQTSAKVEMPVLDSFDKDTKRTTCAGRLELTFPANAVGVLGGGNPATADIKYTSQPAADGSGTVYTVFGAEDLIDGVSAADLRSWAAQSTAGSSATSAGAAQADAGRQGASRVAAAAPPPPSAADLIRDNPALAARDQAVQRLYANALDRDATGQVRAEQSAALVDRSRCRTKACLASWFTRREAALRQWEQ